ncbi:MAG: molybdopterin-dependent oxidoreductase [Synoicihabitans sp.]
MQVALLNFRPLSGPPLPDLSSSVLLPMFLRQFTPSPSASPTDLTPTEFSRRGFMKTSGVFVLAVSLVGRLQAQDKAASALTDVAGGDATPSLWISIESDGTVKITCHRSEMGQQVWTSMGQIVADELEADWKDVKIVQALGHPKYGDQNTDGSRSVRYNFHRLRVAGAAMRTMLEAAAAAHWGISVADCHAELGFVKRVGTQQRLGYGKLAAAAGKLEVPAESDVRLKSRGHWRYIGKPVPSLTVPLIVKGKGTFGIDVDRPNMVHAVIARPPQVFGQVGSFDDAKTKAIKGVLQTVQMPVPEAPPLFKPLGGVAVVATDTWAAIQGRRQLEVTWQDGPNAGYNSDSYRAELEETARKPGTVERNRGDALTTLSNSKRTLTAEYYVPNFSHSQMEPVHATAEWTGDELECWACVQDPQNTRGVLAGFFQIPPEKIKVNATWLGGAFGRKSKPDFVVEAAFIAKQVGKPVKVTWTREDDLQHGYYHAVSAQRLEAALDEDGSCDALLHRTVFPSIGSTFNPAADQGGGGELGLGASDTPFAVPNLRLEVGKAKAHLRIGWLRAVCNIQHAFAVQSFAAEMAHAAGRDPKNYLIDLIGEPRIIDPTTEGASYANYDASKVEYPIETGRLSHVTRKVSEMAGWGRRLPKGHGLGIAVHRSFLSYVATVVEVKVTPAGEISIPGIWLAVDAGTVVNPRHAVAQMEGGTIFGLSNALYGAITAKNGAVEQANFPDWRLMRMSESPQAFETHIVDSSARPAGLGEPATPPAAPALTNAIFAATGKRIRTLPILGPNGTNLNLG